MTHRQGRVTNTALPSHTRGSHWQIAGNVSWKGTGTHQEGEAGPRRHLHAQGGDRGLGAVMQLSISLRQILVQALEKSLAMSPEVLWQQNWGEFGSSRLPHAGGDGDGASHLSPVCPSCPLPVALLSLLHPRDTSSARPGQWEEGKHGRAAWKGWEQHRDCGTREPHGCPCSTWINILMAHPRDVR